MVTATTVHTWIGLRIATVTASPSHILGYFNRIKSLSHTFRAHRPIDTVNTHHVYAHAVYQMQEKISRISNRERTEV